MHRLSLAHVRKVFTLEHECTFYENKQKICTCRKIVDISKDVKLKYGGLACEIILLIKFAFPQKIVQKNLAGGDWD